MFLPFFRVLVIKVMALIPVVYRHPLKRGLNIEGHRFRECEMPDEPTAETWAYFASRYGLTQEDEIRFSQDLDRVKSLPFMLNALAFDVMVDKDCY